jgi:hypothetical protein
MKIYLIGIAIIFLSACTTVSYDLHPKSHYDFPNSNIKPLGAAVGKASQVTLFIPPMLSGEIERLAVQEALSSKPGSHLLINYVSETKITSLGIIPIHIIDYTVHGTAASMSVGLQKIKK